MNARRLLACLLLCAVWPCPAQTPAANGGSEVALLRIQFERDWIAASLEPVKKQLTALGTLERQLAAARDYDGAIRVRTQRQQWQAELERLDKQLLLLQTREQALKAAQLPARIQLSVEAATLNGVTLAGGALTGWSKPGASATWKLPSLPPGGYEVVLRYRCGPLEGGTVTARESRFTLTGPVETTLRGPESRNLGTLKISEGATTLTVSAVTIVKDNLMQLLEVELVPARR
ncbi:MAG: hypothetical protein HS117_24255 [Verrucomicrobiaceae bacterium]|nr:hypothetical protein [Verrucomicrobiaceae bacterium]